MGVTLFDDTVALSVAFPLAERCPGRHLADLGPLLDQLHAVPPPIRDAADTLGELARCAGNTQCAEPLGERDGRRNPIALKVVGSPPNLKMVIHLGSLHAPI